MPPIYTEKTWSTQGDKPLLLLLPSQSKRSHLTINLKSSAHHAALSLPVKLRIHSAPEARSALPYPFAVCIAMDLIPEESVLCFSYALTSGVVVVPVSEEPIPACAYLSPVCIIMHRVSKQPRSALSDLASSFFIMDRRPE